MMYRRALSYQRPYGLLMNTDFSRLTYELVERYFQVALFYAIYPSMFSHNASSDRYWDDPALYERDRPLFRRYIPLIRTLNTAGWQPLTYAAAGDPRVHVERYGRWPDLYFALRNTQPDGPQPATIALAIDRRAVGIPAYVSSARALLRESEVPVVLPGASQLLLSLPLAPGETELLRFTRGGGGEALLPWAGR